MKLTTFQFRSRYFDRVVERRGGWSSHPPQKDEAWAEFVRRKTRPIRDFTQDYDTWRMEWERWKLLKRRKPEKNKKWIGGDKRLT